MRSHNRVVAIARICLPLSLRPDARSMDVVDGFCWRFRSLPDDPGSPGASGVGIRGGKRATDELRRAKGGNGRWRAMMTLRARRHHVRTHRRTHVDIPIEQGSRAWTS